MHNPIALAIAEDEPHYRDILLLRLRKFKQVEVLFAAAGGAELLQQIEKGKVPQVVLMDVRMPDMNGIAATQLLHTKFPGIKVVAWSQWDTAEEVAQMIRCGASAFIHKVQPVEEVVHIIESVARGHYHLADNPYGKELVNLLIDSPTPAAKLPNRLTEVLLCICNQMNSREISVKLGISEECVKGYRKDLMRITGAKNMVGLAQYAMEHRLMAQVSQ